MIGGGDNNIMQASGSKDLGCGIHSYSITETGAKIACRDEHYKIDTDNLNLDIAIEKFQ